MKLINQLSDRFHEPGIALSSLEPRAPQTYKYYCCLPDIKSLNNPLLRNFDVYAENTGIRYSVSNSRFDF